VCWYTALLEDVSVTVMAQVDEASAQHNGNVQQYKSFIGQISSSRFEVILTALLMEQINQNCPKTKN